jgi:hypothetical protein
MKKDLLYIFAVCAALSVLGIVAVIFPDPSLLVSISLLPIFGLTLFSEVDTGTAPPEIRTNVFEFPKHKRSFTLTNWI